jgi:hypothetical protein
MSKSRNRQVVKSLVKECLIEILAEGLVGNSKASLRETRELRGAVHEAYDRSERTSSRNISEKPLNMTTQSNKSNYTSPKRPTYLDNIKMGVDNHKNANSEKIKESVKHITDDPIMADIFADTALTTLKEQTSGGRPSGPSVSSQGDSAAKIVDQSLPEDLFGGASSNWANLAFAPSIRKK